MPPTSSAAKPLNVTPSATPSKLQDSGAASGGKGTAAGAGGTGKVNPTDISSPHELTAFVENLLEQLDANFDAMSSQILDRMTEMSQRVDSLEASIQDIINGDVSAPPTSSAPSSPGPPAAATLGPGGRKRSGSSYLSRGGD